MQRSVMLRVGVTIEQIENKKLQKLLVLSSLKHMNIYLNIIKFFLGLKSKPLGRHKIVWGITGPKYPHRSRPVYQLSRAHVSNWWPTGQMWPATSFYVVREA